MIYTQKIKLGDCEVVGIQPFARAISLTVYIPMDDLVSGSNEFHLYIQRQVKNMVKYLRAEGFVEDPNIGNWMMHIGIAPKLA